MWSCAMVTRKPARSPRAAIATRLSNSEAAGPDGVSAFFPSKRLPLSGLGTKPTAAMASIGSFSFPSNGFEAVIFDCDGTLVDSMPQHFDAWCEALALFGACGVFKEDVFFAMGGRPTRDIVVELNDEYDLHLDPEAVAFAKREAFLKRIKTVTLID